MANGSIVLNAVVLVWYELDKEQVLLDNSGLLVYTVRMIIDTHCHLVHEKYDDIEQIRTDSLALGVGHCISQGTHPQDWLPQLELARRMPDFITSCLAAHPSEVTNVSDEDFEYMANLCRQYPQVWLQCIVVSRNQRPGRSL